VRPRRSGSASCPASPALRAARQGQAPARTAGFPAIPASLGCPRMVPVSNGECISTACASVAQEPAGIHFEFFFIHMFAHRIMAVIRTLQQLSTALCTNHPQLPAVTRGKPRTSSSVLSRRRLVAGLGPGARWWTSRPGSRRGGMSWLWQRAHSFGNTLFWARRHITTFGWGGGRSRAARRSGQRGGPGRRGGSERRRGPGAGVVPVTSRCRGRPPPRCRPVPAMRR
jgi:hypothetical protein